MKPPAESAAGRAPRRSLSASWVELHRPSAFALYHAPQIAAEPDPDRFNDSRPRPTSARGRLRFHPGTRARLAACG